MPVPLQTIDALFPSFAAELADLCRREGHFELACQLGALPVVARCTCGEMSCAHFYTAPPPKGAYGPGHSNVVLPAETGMIVLDIVNGRIVAVEALDRPDVKQVLDAYLPTAP